MQGICTAMACGRLPGKCQASTAVQAGAGQRACQTCRVSPSWMTSFTRGCSIHSFRGITMGLLCSTTWPDGHPAAPAFSCTFPG